MTERKARKENRDVVRFNVYLPQESYDKLEELRVKTGKRSLAETLRAALKLYDEKVHGAEAADVHITRV